MQGASASTYEDLSGFIDENAFEALNCDDSFPLQNALLARDDSYLQSESDPQLLLRITFNRHVKIHHFVVYGGKDEECRPKTIKFFVNHIGMDFHTAENEESTQEFQLNKKDFGRDIDVRFVKFQYIKDITVFVEDNHGGDTTQISQLTFYGNPGEATEMKNLKKPTNAGPTINMNLKAV